MGRLLADERCCELCVDGGEQVRWLECTEFTSSVATVVDVTFRGSRPLANNRDVLSAVTGAKSVNDSNS